LENPELFISIDSTILRKSIPRQMSVSEFNTSFNNGAGTLNDFMLFLLIVFIFLSLFESVGIVAPLLINLIRTLSLIIHVAMFKINLPANITTIFSALVPTIGFDILEKIIDWEDQSFILYDFKR